MNQILLAAAGIVPSATNLVQMSLRNLRRNFGTLLPPLLDTLPRTDIQGEVVFILTAVLSTAKVDPSCLPDGMADHLRADMVALGILPVRSRCLWLSHPCCYLLLSTMFICNSGSQPRHECILRLQSGTSMLYTAACSARTAAGEGDDICIACGCAGSEATGGATEPTASRARPKVRCALQTRAL